jgi:hypothetical protein
MQLFGTFSYAVSFCFCANRTESGMPMDKTEIDNILASVWQTAVHNNPMLLAKLRPDFDFHRLEEMIADCLGKGLSKANTIKHTVRELLQSASTNSQPSNNCDDTGPNHREAQSAH